MLKPPWPEFEIPATPITVYWPRGLLTWGLLDSKRTLATDTRRKQDMVGSSLRKALEAGRHALGVTMVMPSSHVARVVASVPGLTVSQRRGFGGDLCVINIASTL